MITRGAAAVGGARRMWPLRAPALPREAWLAGGLLAAVALAAAGLQRDGATCAVLAVAALAAGAAFYEPRAVGPLLALSLPLEITKLAFPFLETRAELGGGLPPTSVVDAGRLAVALACAVWLVRPGRPRADIVAASPLALPLALLFAAYALSTLYARDVSAARVESLRLVLSFAMFALVPFFVRDRRSLRWTLYALVASMAALSLVALYQQASGDFLWNAGLGLYGERRVNTTFADPNHFARFLLCGIVVAMTLWFFVERRLKFAFLLPALALAMLALAFSGSRGAWLTGAIVLPATMWLLPVPRPLRVRMLAMGAGLVVLTVLVIAAMNPYFSKRVDTFAFGFQAAGARPYLVRAGLDMFGDQPLAGVGAGGYQTAFEEDYARHKDPSIKADVTISHTSLVTLASELGLAGLAVLAFLAARWVAYARVVMARSGPTLRAAALGLATITLVIFLGSQTEGRFFEDPYLWLAAGLVVAIDRIEAPRRRVFEAPP